MSFLLSTIYSFSRPLHRELSKKERIFGVAITATAATIFALLLSFTVSNFLQRFIDIRDNFIKEVTDLQIIFRVIRTMPDTQAAVDSIRRYVQSVVEDEWPLLMDQKESPRTEALYRIMDNTIIEYIRQHPSQMSTALIERLSTNERQRRLTSALRDNNNLIIIIVIAAIITLLGFWVLFNESNTLLYIFDFMLISVIIIGIFLLFVFDRPLSIQGIGFTDSIYKDLLEEINSVPIIVEIENK